MTPAFVKSLSAGLALLGATIAAAPAMAAIKALEGTVAYRERMALPPGASVEIKLVDVSLADSPSKTLAEITFTPEGQVPLPYRLEYDDAEIQPGRSYALQARITLGDRLMFITTTRHAVFTGEAGETNIMVERVVAAPASPAGRWLAEDIRGRGVIDNLQTVLEIAEDGKVSGSGGCNRMSGMATIAGDDIAFGPIASTKMACAPAVMDQETKFFAALSDVRTWRADPSRGKLTLLDKGGDVLVVFSRM
ncbi:YbaY family lipoprotein [Rhizobium sp. LCM 4573]|uniref:YbaY family lipoprotein n=1 Tax=Rhizobium sp. LCM 4573 TaxID=1848291 RepID=UPI0008D96767|nr:YbaY family lipoprotein [Rhizobium sp. LCM 4573]OHV83817.1 hypothetical protein LCM4573_06285 [Rhizobium sp. LCM 4573]